ncbi:MAG: hypothetical protein Q7K03_04205 [Dehalococcoidia bacterium]|nr:hypothetical protein [Dehalococcoidia bacterium]
MANGLQAVRAVVPKCGAGTGDAMTPHERREEQWRLPPASECVPSNAELIAEGQDPMDDERDGDVLDMEADMAEMEEGERVRATLPPDEAWCYSHRRVEQARDAVDFVCSPTWYDYYRRRGMIR